MLVLTRRQGESIIIGEGIKLTVVSVGPGRVKIGITAPPDVRIDREEIHTRIQQEQLQEEHLQIEHAADVLDAVGSRIIDGDGNQNTMVNSTSETGILYKLPDQPHIVSSSLPIASIEKVPKNRHMRKPR